MSNEADNAPLSEPAVTDKSAARTKASRLLPFRIKASEEVDAVDAYIAVHGCKPPTDTDLMRWCIQRAAESLLAEKTIGERNEEIIQLQQKIDNHFLIEKTPVTIALVEAQQRRAAAKLESSASITEFVSHIYQIILSKVTNKKAELLA